MIAQLGKSLLPAILLVFFAASTLLGSSSNAGAQEESITIGLLPEMNVFKQKQRFEPPAAYLSERMGIAVKLSILSRYGNIIDRIG